MLVYGEGYLRANEEIIEREKKINPALYAYALRIAIQNAKDNEEDPDLDDYSFGDDSIDDIEEF